MLNKTIDIENLTNGKMKILVYFILIIFYSCALFDGYKLNQHSAYERILNDNDRNEIHKVGFIFKNWYGESGDNGYSKGMLYIEKMEKNNKYNFVEIGLWDEEFKTNNGSIIKIITDYDNYGNVIGRKVWDKPKRRIESYLQEVWSSKKILFNADTLLIQTIQTYYSNGISKSKFSLSIFNHDTYLSDRLKTKYKIDTLSHFNEDGSLNVQKIYHVKDKIIGK